ncbi:MAG: hypothetical protein M3O26_19355 [Pseudomonadota bacterium]|nr:hypothetical protein [Pseudomonadota bacterium]
MDSLKPFDPNDIDETLTRIVTHRGKRYLLFPFVNAIGAAPKFDSISHVIEAPSATIKDFSALSGLVRQTGETLGWFISFSTPWLMRLSEAEKLQRTSQRRAPRE